MASLRGCGYATLMENKQMVTHCGLLYKFTRGMSAPDPSPQQHSPEEFSEFEQCQKEWTRKKGLKSLERTAHHLKGRRETAKRSAWQNSLKLREPVPREGQWQMRMEESFTLTQGMKDSEGQD